MRSFSRREIERIADRIQRARPKVVIATSGTAASLAAVCHGLYKTRGSRATAVSRTQMRRIAKLLDSFAAGRAQTTLRRRAPARRNYCRWRQPSTPRLLDRCQLRGFRYSPLGFRDGLLAQMAAEYDRSTRSGKADRIRTSWDSIRAAVEHYHVDLDHAPQGSRFGHVSFHRAEVDSPPSARISRMALRRSHALRSRRLCEPQRTPSPHLLHHRTPRFSATRPSNAASLPPSPATWASPTGTPETVR